MEIELLPIDFREVFDSIRRKELLSAMKILGVTPKFRSLINMTLIIISTGIKTQKLKSSKLIKEKDKKTLSVTYFKRTLEYVN